MENAYFAGGCFWCITPVFKVYGASDVVCGYSGKDNKQPTYEEVKSQKTSFRETICVTYDPDEVQYETLLDIFMANIDPFDEGGQYIDRGFSYTTAIFYRNEAERELAERKLAELEEQEGKKPCVSLEKFENFFRAEEYHQDYYLKNPEAFEKELKESGRKS